MKGWLVILFLLVIFISGGLLSYHLSTLHANNASLTAPGIFTGIIWTLILIYLAPWKNHNNRLLVNGIHLFASMIVLGALGIGYIAAMCISNDQTQFSWYNAYFTLSGSIYFHMNGILFLSYTRKKLLEERQAKVE